MTATPASHLAYRPFAKTHVPTFLPINERKARVFLYRGVEHFSSTDALLVWVHQNRTPKQPVFLAHTPEHGYCLAGYADV